MVAQRSLRTRIPVGVLLGAVALSLLAPSLAPSTLAGADAPVRAASLNDDFASAFDIPSLPHSEQLDTSGATVENGEPAPSCAFAWGASVWYYFVPSTPGNITVSTAGSPADRDTILAVYTGGTELAALGEVACNDDIDIFSGNYLSQVTFECIAGQTYYIQLSGYAGEVGGVTLDVSDCTVEAALPNLVPAFSDPGCLAVGGEYTFYIGTINTGTGLSPASSTSYSLWGGGASIQVPPLVPGGSYAYEWNLITETEGLFELTITADALAEVAESNESDNGISLQLCVQEFRPDLRVGLEAGPCVTSGQPASVEVTLINDGPGDTAFFETHVSHPGGTESVFSYGLEAGNSSTITLPLDLGVGMHTVTALVDAFNSNEETDEANNQAEAVLCVRPPALEAGVVMLRPAFSVTENAAGVVTASRAGGAIADGVDVAVAVAYTSGDASVDGALAALGCTGYTTQGVTDNAGLFTFVVPRAFFARCLGGPDLVEAPTNLLGGSYDVYATVDDAWSTSEATTTYTVTLP